MPHEQGTCEDEGPTSSPSGAEINHVSEAWVPSWFCPFLGLSPPQSRRMVVACWVMAEWAGLCMAHKNFRTLASMCLCVPVWKWE